MPEATPKPFLRECEVEVLLGSSVHSRKSAAVEVAIVAALLLGLSRSAAFAEDVYLDRRAPLVALLPNDELLIAGGKSKRVVVKPGDIDAVLLRSYVRVDIRAKRIISSGLMDSSHLYGQAVALPEGRVVVIGGLGRDAQPTGIIEMYDPTEDVFRKVGELQVGRTDHSATLLPDGGILVAGGVSRDFKNLSSAEIIDSRTFDTRVLVPGMCHARHEHVATLLRDGRILITGGRGVDARRTAEVFDPGSQRFQRAGPVNHCTEERHSATLLSDGKVLLLSGESAGLFIPETGEFRALEWRGAPGGPRVGHSATLLRSGDVLIVGGRPGGRGHPTVDMPFLFLPADNSFLPLTGSRMDNRGAHAAILHGEDVLLVGKGGSSVSCELVVRYDSSERVFVPLKLSGSGSSAEHQSGRQGGRRLPDQALTAGSPPVSDDLPQEEVRLPVERSRQTYGGTPWVLLLLGLVGAATMVAAGIWFLLHRRTP